MFGQSVAPKNLCVLRLSAIGDVCNAVAVVQKIQKHWPHTQITWVCGKTEANLLRGIKKIDVINFDKSAGLDAYLDFRHKMKGNHFDLVLHMQVSFRSSLVSFLIPASIKLGFDKKRAIEGQSWFTNKQIAPQEQPHVLDGFIGFAEALGIEKFTPEWDMNVSDEDQTLAINTLNTDLPTAVIAPAASKAERNWTVDGYAKIAEYLQNLGFNVVLCGGPTTLEVELAENIRNISRAKIHNLVGKTSLKQLLAILKVSHLTIAPDTGPAHMSGTVGTPVVGLYAHSNPRRTGPYLYQRYVVSCYDEVIQEQHGKPFSELPWGTRAKGDDLMERINVEQVKSKVHALVCDHYPDLLKFL